MTNVIRVTLQERYAEGKIPRGILSAISREFSVSRQRVAQIAKELGFVVYTPLIANDNKFCYICKTEKRQGNSPYCSTHINTNVQCAYCEILFVKPRSQVQRLYKIKGRALTFCSKEHFHAFGGPRKVSVMLDSISDISEDTSIKNSGIEGVHDLAFNKIE